MDQENQNIYLEPEIYYQPYCSLNQSLPNCSIGVSDKLNGTPRIDEATGNNESESTNLKQTMTLEELDEYYRRRRLRDHGIDPDKTNLTLEELLKIKERKEDRAERERKRYNAMTPEEKVKFIQNSNENSRKRALIEQEILNNPDPTPEQKEKVRVIEERRAKKAEYDKRRRADERNIKLELKKAARALEFTGKIQLEKKKKGKKSKAGGSKDQEELVKNQKEEGQENVGQLGLQELNHKGLEPFGLAEKDRKKEAHPAETLTNVQKVNTPTEEARRAHNQENEQPNERRILVQHDEYHNHQNLSEEDQYEPQYLNMDQACIWQMEETDDETSRAVQGLLYHDRSF